MSIIAPMFSDQSETARLFTKPEQNWKQDMIYDFHQAVRAFHVIINGWRDSKDKDPLEVAVAAIGTAEQLTALADQIKFRVGVDSVSR